MVSTRSQASNLHEPRSSPSKTPTGISAGTSGKKTWAHTPSNLTLLWLIVSLPLVFWDTGYVLLRPHSMPGGSLHSPIWIPYALYGTIDYIYGWPAYNAHNGFTAAQGSLNVVESVFYMYYLWIVYKHGRPSSTKGRGAPKPSAIGWLGEAKIVPGRAGAIASVVAFSAAIMTVSKTLLYCKPRSSSCR